MGRHLRGLVALMAGFSAAVLALPAYAEPRPEAQTAVGGPLLARDGIVVHKAPDVRDLPKVDASSYVVADYETGRVLAAKDPHGHYRPASTLKILTAITLIPVLDPDDTVRPTQADCNVEGSKVGLTPKMDYPVDDLFRALLMASGNDAALALARGAGGLDETLERMNATARRLRAHDTVARTPNGLDKKGQRSSAYDLALLARHGLGMPDFRDYVGTVRAEFPAPKDESYEIATHNRLLRPGPDSFDGAIGVKNGWTSKAEASFVGAAERDGDTVIVALMHSQPYFWKDARQLLRWGLAARGEAVPVGALVEPTPTATPTPSPHDATAPPTAAAPAPGDPTASDGQPTLPVAAGVAAGVAAAVLVGSGTAGWLVVVRRRRAPEP